VSLPVEFQRLVRPGAKILLIEDLVSKLLAVTLGRRPSSARVGPS